MTSLADDLRTAPTTFRPFRPDPVQPAALRAALERARLASWRPGTRIMAKRSSMSSKAHLSTRSTASRR